MATASKKYPDFFKVFIPKQSDERMLIPKAFVNFVESLQEKIPKNVILRNCRGRGWHVETRSIGDKLYFDDCWKVFHEENSLKAADFLVFSYDGTNEFRFIILEPSTSCEKTVVKEEEEEEQEQEQGKQKEKEDTIEVEEVEIKGEEHEEMMENGEEQQLLDEDSEEDDFDYYDHNNNGVEMEMEIDHYDDSESDEDTDLEEENEEEYKVGNMRNQCHRRGRKPKRKIPRSYNSRARGTQLEDYGREAEMYIQPDNPYFVAKLYKSRPNELHIPTNVIKDYSLIFPPKVTLVCCQCQGKPSNEVRAYHLSLPQQTIVRKKYKEVEGDLCTWKDGRLCIQGWTSFCRKNKINENDICLCEIVVEQEPIVKLLQVHVLGAEKVTDTQANNTTNVL